MRTNALTVFLLLSLVASASCILFGRSSILQPPPVSAPLALGVVDRDARLAVFLTDYGHTLTKTTAFRNGETQYAHVTRNIDGVPAAHFLASDKLYVSAEENTITYLLQTEYAFTVPTVSLSEWRVIRNITVPTNGLYSGVDGWAYGRYPDSLGGAPFVVMVAGGGVLWQLPNGTLASLTIPVLSLLGLLLNDTTLYLLVEPVPGTGPVQALIVDLVSAAVTTTALITPPSGAQATTCAFVYRNTTDPAAPDIVAFLMRNDTARLLIALDPVAAALTQLGLASTDPLPAPPTLAGPLPVRCIVTAPLEFLLFDETGLWAGDLGDDPPSTTSIALTNSLNYWIDAVLDQEGDLLVSTCDAGRYAIGLPGQCALLWFDALNVSANSTHSPSSPPVRFAPMMAHYSASMLVGDLGVFFLGDPGERAFDCGVLITDLAADSPPPVWIYVSTMPEQSLVKLELDPVTLTVCVLALLVFVASLTPRRYLIESMRFRFDNDSLYVLDWRSPKNGTQPFGAVYGLGDISSNQMSVSLLPYNNTVLYYAQELATPDSIYLLRATLDNYSVITSASTPSDVIKYIYRLRGGAVLLIGSDFITLLDSTLQVSHQWDEPDPQEYAALATYLSPDQSTLYVWSSSYRADVNNTLCAYVNLTAPHGNFTIRSAQASLTDYYTSSGVGTSAHNYLFLAAAGENTWLVARYSLDCDLQATYDTRLTQPPLVAYSDRLIFGSYPVLSPVYLDCGVGTFRNVTDGRCEACPNGTASMLVDTQACLPCPARTAPDAAHMYCECMAGFYSAANDQDCGVCPTGGVCSGGNALAPQPGYWRANATSSRFYACPLARGCNGSDVCAGGYTGPLCAVCEAQHALVVSDCLSCASPLVSAAYWLVAALVYLAAFAALVFASDSSFSVLKSFISFAQIVTFPASGPVPRLLHREVAVLTRYLSLANFQILSIVSPDCLLGRHVTYPVEAVASATLPLLVIAALAAFFSLPWERIRARLCCVFRRRASSGSLHAASDPFAEQPPSFADKIVAYRRSGSALRVTLFVVLLCTPSAMQQLSSYFNCEEVASVVYLVRDFTVRCYTGAWVWFAPAVGVLLCVYAVGVPAALFVLLYRYRETLDVRFLHSSYKEEYYWWDCTEHVRKLTLLLINTVVAPRAPEYYGTCSLALSVVALSIHLKVQAYAKERDFWFQCADLAGICLFFLWSVLATGDTNQVSVADTAAWAYWLFAVAYTCASLTVLVLSFRIKVQTLLQAAGCCKRSYSAGGDSELDALIPRKP